VLPSLCLAAILSGAPQGRVLVVAALEAQGASAVQLATVRNAVLDELKSEGYDARAAELGTPKNAAGKVDGALVLVDGVFEVALKLQELGSSKILSTTRVRCGSAARLAEAAKTAASQLASEGREQWGVRARFKAK
jgi:hypothetical protein